jgi:FMN reductase
MLIVGIGGTTRPGSSSETALRIALDVAEQAGCTTRAFGADDLRLPLYDPTDRSRSRKATALLRAVEEADGFILSSPGYHGTVSGLVKNALDYTEDLRDNDRPYLADRPVGCIAVAYGWQAAVNTLNALRDITHALRGWPTPYGASVNASGHVFEQGRCVDADVELGLRLVGRQVVDLATVLTPS